MSDLYPEKERYQTIGSTVYRWVGNLVDLREANGWDRIAMIHPQTTKKSWQQWLRHCIFSRPVASQGKTREEFEALKMVGVWKPEDAPSEGHSITLDEGAGLFDFDFES